jgi:hypothetical protein
MHCMATMSMSRDTGPVFESSWLPEKPLILLFGMVDVLDGAIKQLGHVVSKLITRAIKMQKLIRKNKADVVQWRWWFDPWLTCTQQGLTKTNPCSFSLRTLLLIPLL